MADTFSEAKEHGRHSEDNFYNIGDIVELRQPKGILGCIKYIGPKLNANGELISSDIHYIIQLEEYVGNGNGQWHGHQYIPYLRPDKTMHMCKYSNIRCKRTSDDILKALYNILRTNNKLKKQIKQQQNYITELQNINYKFEQHLQSQTYYLIPKSNINYPTQTQTQTHSHNTSHGQKLSLQNLPNLPLQSIAITATSTTNLNTQTPHELEFNNNLNPLPNSPPTSTENENGSDNSNSSESIEISDKELKSEKWVGLLPNKMGANNLITPPPIAMNMTNNNNNTIIRHNKFNNSLTLDILQQKTRRSHRRNQSEEYVINNGTHRIQKQRHRSNTFNENDINEITPAPYINDINTPPLAPVTVSTYSMGHSMDNSIEFEYCNGNIKQKKWDIKYGKNNINTHGKMQLYEREIEKQKSMDKLKNNKLVKNKVNMFENRNNENLNIKNCNGNDRKSYGNLIDDDCDDESDSINQMENEGICQENGIGNYDDSTMIIHTDQLVT